MKTKILKIAGIILLVLVTFVWATPFLFKGKITRLVKTHINKNLQAQVNFSDVDISLFRHFPKIAIGLDNLQVICVGEFQGDTLMSAKLFDIACDIQSLISGDSIQVYSITVKEPSIHARIHKDGHANWNIGKSNEQFDTSARVFNLGIKQYSFHNGYVDFLDERKDMHVVVVNLEHEGNGDFNSGLFTLKTKTTADAINFDAGGVLPYRVTAKTSIDMAFRVESKTHTYSFNTDQVSFNDLKLHTEGFFQWINDSSYNMNIRFKTPSTKFKNILSLLPTVYQKDFASIEANGQVNFNGFIKGKYDEKHFPAYHTNLYVQNGYFKYPDLAVPVENINLGLQVDNPDGNSDHLTINISEAHAEVNKDTLDFHLLVKNLKTKPFIDFAFVGKLDLANVSKWIKLESGTRLSGLLDADIHANGNVPESQNLKKDGFQSWGNFNLSNFSWASKSSPSAISLNELLLTFNSKNVLVKELKGDYYSTHIDVTGTLNNLFDFALRNKPLKASMDLRADEFNLREWIGTDHDSSEINSDHNKHPFQVPENMDFIVHAKADKLHYDNLDLQNISCNLLIAEQKIQLQDLRANGLDGEISMDGSYSTLVPGEKPEMAMSYDVKGLDIQKTFLAFYSLRKIIPVAKFMAGNFNGHLSLNTRLNDDMTTDLQSLQGDGNVLILMATLKDFSPVDKLSQSLEIGELKEVCLKETKADFTFKAGVVTVPPFLARMNDIDMEICGIHGFDQSLDYDINLKLPRSQLGSKGRMFVKNVVEQAADKGIPLKLQEIVNMDVKMNGTINNPNVKADMDAMVDYAATDLKKEVKEFVNAKLDSAKQQLHKPTVKKPLYSQAVYKPKANLKSKKTSKSTLKKAVHSKSKKKKKPVKNYTLSLKKEKSTASNSH